jgi:transposase
MGHNFRPVEREQQYLMPVSLRDWLPADDLVWFVIDAVEQMDLTVLRARYRADGWGAPAYDPALMTTLLLYAYATGERSSRGIEARCRRDVAYRVICANAVPDHATIARFRAEHEVALAGLFGDVLRLCREAGLGKLGLVALDGTKIAASASGLANRGADALDAEIAAMLAEAAATDAAEDAELGPERRGDELPAALADPRSRLARLGEARRQLAEAEAERSAAFEAQLARRAEREASSGRRDGGRPPRADAARHSKGWAKRNTTDPDSRPMKGATGWVQGYNAQAVVAADGVVLASAVTQDVNEAAQLAPMLTAAADNAARAGLRGRIREALADGNYWSEANAALEVPGAPRLLIPPPEHRRTPGGRRAPGAERMRRRLARPSCAARYRRRAAIVEPVFGHTKEVLRVRRFQRRGLHACESEWAIVCTAHNLLKAWRHGRHGVTRSTRPTPSRPPHRPATGRHGHGGARCRSSTPADRPR